MQTTSGSTGALKFGILGPLEVRDGERTLTPSGGRQRALLALLLLQANEIVSTDRLMDALWGDEPPGSGATALQVLVSRLRAALGAGGADLLTQAPGYVLRVERGRLDLDRFEALLAEADGAEPSVAASKLRDALALWRGPALGELAYESFAQPAVGRLEELRIVALERRIAADLELGRHAELVGELEGLVVEHPLREGFRCQQLLALYRSGRQAEALEAYRAARDTLVEELGLEPGPALQELERAILRHDAALELARESTPDRSILVAPLDEARLGALLAVAEPLASGPPRELIVAGTVAEAELGPASARLRLVRDDLLSRGQAARVAAFTSTRPDRDLVRLASEQDVDLLLLDAREGLLDDEVTQLVLRGAPCDVALLASPSEPLTGDSVLVPFAGAEHDWSAIELAAWAARNIGKPLRLAGPREEERDASRLLASASLAVQRALSVAAEPLLVDPGTGGLLEAAHEAALVVMGLSERWRKDGLGPVRHALATQGEVPTLLVRRGVRPGGLAPREALTRFTWSAVVSPS
jgi:DNA-binding SARP family transcriptional activator